MIGSIFPPILAHRPCSTNPRNAAGPPGCGKVQCASRVLGKPCTSPLGPLSRLIKATEFREHRGSVEGRVNEVVWQLSSELECVLVTLTLRRTPDACGFSALRPVASESDSSSMDVPGRRPAGRGASVSRRSAEQDICRPRAKRVAASVSSLRVLAARLRNVA